MWKGVCVFTTTKGAHVPLLVTLATRSLPSKEVSNDWKQGYTWRLVNGPGGVWEESGQQITNEATNGENLWRKGFSGDCILEGIG